jgi:hypothetical protein
MVTKGRFLFLILWVVTGVVINLGCGNVKEALPLSPPRPRRYSSSEEQIFFENDAFKEKI